MANDCLQIISLLTDLIIAATSIVAIVISVWTILSQRRHEVLTMTPHLSFRIDQDRTKDVYSWHVQNVGGGPALIKEASITIEGQKYIYGAVTPADLPLLRHFGPRDMRYYHYVWQEGDVIGPNAEITMLKMSGSVDPSARELMRSIEFSITFESAYGERVTRVCPRLLE